MHHAYLFEGSQESLPQLTASARELFGFEGGNNPDVQTLSFEKFGIDDAHVLTSQALLKSVSGRALFILGIASITSEAQQALLKLFEEPQKGTTFVLLMPHGSLIATLRSRVLGYPGIVVKDAASVAEVKKFLRQSYKERSADISALLEDDEGVKERVRDFLNALEQIVYESLQKKPTKDIRDGLADIAKVRSYVADRSPSLKMLLEHLALTLPQG